MVEQSLATLMILTVNLLSNHRGNTSLVCIATHDEHRLSVRCGCKYLIQEATNHPPASTQPCPLLLSE